MSEDRQESPADNQPDIASGDRAADRGAGYSLVKRLLLFLSKTDLHALQFSTPMTEMTQASIGMMVATTGILAFCSCYFAVSSTFFKYDTSILGIIISLFVASVYATAIITFDRKIVAVTDKKFTSYAYRIFFAVLIGIVIAYPVELKIQEGRIDAQITAMVVERNQDKVDEQGNLKAYIAEEREKVLNPYRDDVDSQQKIVSILSDQVSAEGRRVLCGVRCNGLKKELEAAQNRLTQLQARLDKTLSTVDERFASQKDRIGKIESEITQDRHASQDLLSQAMALSVITSGNATARWMGYFLMAFFILFELFPMLIKL